MATLIQLKARRTVTALGLILAAVALLLAACGGDDSEATPTATVPPGQPTAAAEPEGYAHPELLAETEWLAAQLTRTDLRVVDVRERQAYDAGHIPGAVWFDRTLLKDPDDKLHVVRAELFAAKMGELGVGPATEVVIYDEGTGLWAARLWWVLNYYGHDHVRIVNGGWAKWEKEGRAATKEVPAVQPAVFTPKPDPNLVCSIDEVKQFATSPSAEVVLLDVRSQAEYVGADVRAARGGHIPKAVNVDWTLSLTEGDPKVWKPAAELRALFEKAGIKKDSTIITYCQTGVRAAHTLFTLKLIGYGQGNRLYDGSWAEWGNRTDTPIEQ